MASEEEGEGSGTTPPAPIAEHTLADTMTAPLSARPDVVVLDSTYQEDDDEAEEEEPLSNEQDLWLSTVDGRYSSPPIPVRVGQIHNLQTFHVHKDILIKAEWFRKALCGSFREADEQVVDLPEEDPAIFHFLVAFLYEERFDPIKPAASALDPPIDKGKGLDVDTEPAESSDSSSTSSSSGSSSNSDGSERIWQNRRRRAHGNAANNGDQDHEKRPGIHRPGCGCATCITRQDATRCWHCGVRRVPPPPGFRPSGVRVMPPRPHVVNVGPQRGHGGGSGASPSDGTPRIEGEDMRTWLMAYELNLDVYICANRYLMEEFRKSVMRSCIDMLETAGTDAAHPQVLRLCRKLYTGVPEDDPLLKMVLARVGFLQPTLWKRNPDETSEFLVENPELAAAILRETVMRHEASSGAPDLPSMEPAW